jgi:hypothetical protein
MSAQLRTAPQLGSQNVELDNIDNGDVLRSK